MEAKDTVMGDLAPAIIAHADLPMGQAIAIEQAEISFKAGIKEVVEWVKNERAYQNPSVWYSRWQAQLEKWGVEPQVKVKEVRPCSQSHFQKQNVG